MRYDSRYDALMHHDVPTNPVRLTVSQSPRSKDETVEEFFVLKDTQSLTPQLRPKLVKKTLLRSCPR